MISNIQRIIVSHHGFAEVWRDGSNGHQSLHSNRHYQPGDRISAFSAATTTRTPTYLTIQTGERVHITLSPEFLAFINHSCTPNAFFDTTLFQLICIAPIMPGDQITFFYPSTEWEMAQPFSCRCGTAACLGDINGASRLSAAVMTNYRVTDYIRKKLAERA
jgi:SET domain